ncbi:MAG: hypothetical protein ACM3IH_20785 [Sphingobacteriales bacterium]
MVAVTYGVARVTAPKNTERARASVPRKNIATRFLVALMEARLREAHREISRHAHLIDKRRGAHEYPLKPETDMPTGGW